MQTRPESSSPKRQALAARARAGVVVAALLAVLSCLGGHARAAESETGTVQRTSFDHLTTGFELLGQHRDLPCESCHVNAIFKGTPRDCQACHGVGTSVRASAKPANHLLTTNACAFCHTPVAWNPAVNFSHSEVLGSCVELPLQRQPRGRHGPEPHRHRPRLQRLPLDRGLGRRGVQPQRAHHRLRELPRQRESHGPALEPRADDPGRRWHLRGLPFAHQLHDLARRDRNRGDPRHRGWLVLPELPRDRAVHGHDAEHGDRGARFATFDRARQEPSADWRLRRLPRHRVVLGGGIVAACQPHPDQCALRPVPHHARPELELFGDRHPPGRHGMPELPRAGRRGQLRQRQDHNHARAITFPSATSIATVRVVTRRAT